MSSQGLLGAIYQYWNIEPRVRLHRRNTYFEDKRVSNTEALRFGLLFIILGIALLSFGLVGYALIWYMI